MDSADILPPTVLDHEQSRDALCVSYFESVRVSKPSAVQYVVWPQIVSAVTQHRAIAAKELAPLISFASFGGDGTRKKANIECVDALVLDIDKGPELSAILPRLAGLELVAYSTFQHVVDRPRYRIVLPLERSVSADEYDVIWGAMNRRIGERGDGNSKDAGHLFYVPSCPLEGIGEAFTHHQVGQWLEFDSVLRQASVASGGDGAAIPLDPTHKDLSDGLGDIGGETRPPALTLEEARRIRDALRVIPAIDRGIWFRVGAALHWLEQGGDDWGDWPRRIFDWWSQSNDVKNGKPKFELKEQDKVWQSLKPRGGITLASVFDLAKKRFDAVTGLPIDDAGAVDARLWQPPVPSAPNVDPSAHEGAQGLPQPSRTTLAPIIPTTLHGQPVPQRDWLIKDWVPMHQVTALYGDGGTGKTLIAQMMMTAAATGREWFPGLPTRPCRSIGILCEDDGNDMHIRQADINRAYGIDFDALNGMCWLPRAGNDNTLLEFDHAGRGHPTRLWMELRETVLTFGAKLIVVDTAADVFGGNENVRPEVRQFVQLLGSLAREAHGAVLLCAHPSRTGLSSGDGGGGSTAWSNSVRSRLYFSRPTDDGGRGPIGSIPDDRRVLSRKKANYARIGEELPLVWRDGAFYPVGQPLNALGSPMTAEDVFLDALRSLMRSGVELNEARTSPRYAPKRICSAGLSGRYKLRDLEVSMHRLLAAQRIKLEPVGPPSKGQKRLVIAEPVAAAP